MFIFQSCKKYTSDWEEEKASLVNMFLTCTEIVITLDFDLHNFNLYEFKAFLCVWVTLAI